MTDQDSRPNAALAGTFPLGGDLLVNRMGFGAMRLTGRGILGEPEDPEQARRVLRRAVELGMNLIDTADSYDSCGGTASSAASSAVALTVIQTTSDGPPRRSATCTGASQLPRVWL
jgi:diketogulonate reductase-like aldo/keto reductase